MKIASFLVVVSLSIIGWSLTIAASLLSHIELSALESIGIGTAFTALAVAMHRSWFSDL